MQTNKQQIDNILWKCTNLHFITREDITSVGLLFNIFYKLNNTFEILEDISNVVLDNRETLSQKGHLFKGTFINTVLYSTQIHIFNLFI